MSRNILLLTGIALAVGALASSAGANHVPGATYNGNVDGGGTIQFTVSPDGASVSQLRLANVPGSICIFTEATFSGTYAVSGEPHGFSTGTSTTNFVNGTFHVVQGAQGSLRLRTFAPPYCDTGTKSWSATTPTAPPPPPPPPPPEVKCNVPRVVGLRLASAKTRIRARKCSVGQIRRARSKRVGRVIGQNPKAGTVKPRNFPVRLVVGRR